MAEALNNFINKIMYNPTVFARKTAEMSPEDLAAYTARFNAAKANPLSFKKLDGGGSGIGTTLGLGLNKVKAHPIKSAGIGLLGAGNLAGLFDNNKIAGQLVGAGAGTALPFLLNNVAGTSFGVPGKIMFGLGGGALGSLFDKLMARKEQEQQMAQQYQGQY